MLDAALKTQLKGYLGRLVRPIELIASLDETARSADLLALLREIADQSDKIRVRLDGRDTRRPSFAIAAPGAEIDLRFAGLPLGHEFTSLVLALLQVGGHPPRIDADQIGQARALEGDFVFETYFSQSCQNCPDVVQALNLLSVLNPGVRHVAVDGALFPEEVEARGVMAVPTVFLNGEVFAQGRMDLSQILARLDKGAAERASRSISAKAPFDILVVGGGPAGAAAAVYAARKGLRTGLVADRIGGQVLDTLAIENFISVPHTEGPRMAAALDQHMRAYGVDVMTPHRAARLTPAAQAGGLVRLELEGGAQIAARSVILATGARWRAMGVPGEEAYRNKGVAYCPHCDGPLFKAKRVAVVGGGNSGVEAAIDLAGLAAHVTLVEFADTLKADAVLRRKLASLANVSVLTGTQTTEVLGDGSRVTGLSVCKRGGGDARRIDVDGVFVQIGLVPNTDWLNGVIELNERGEVVVDTHGQTSVAGVFAAGDATTAPYKQIIVAMGEGAKAGLAAFDRLIRLSPDRPQSLAA